MKCWEKKKKEEGKNTLPGSALLGTRLSAFYLSFFLGRSWFE